MIGYLEAQLVVRATVIREALLALEKNTYKGLHDAREILRRAVDTMGEP